MPGEIDLPLPDPGSLQRGRFTYFPVVPGRAGIRHRSAPGHPARPARRWSRSNCRPRCSDAWIARRASGCPRCRVIFYPDESAGEDQAVYVPVEPADPFTEAIRTGLEIGAEIVFADPDAGERPHLHDAYPDPYAIRHIGLDAYVEAYRVYPQPRSEEIARHAAGIAWKLQGADPAGARAGGGLAEPARPGAGRHGRTAGPAAWRARAARASSCSIRTRNRWPRSPSNIPSLQWRYEQFRA